VSRNFSRLAQIARPPGLIFTHVDRGARVAGIDTGFGLFPFDASALVITIADEDIDLGTASVRFGAAPSLACGLDEHQLSTPFYAVSFTIGLAS